MANIEEIVARVTADVVKEIAANEGRQFEVSDLKAQLVDLASVKAAWTISYSTASDVIDEASRFARLGGQAAWTISYSTASTLAAAKAAER